MNPNPWLIAIVPVILAAVLGAVLSPSMARAVLALARARAQRVKYVPVSGTYLYANGVPLTEEQFREAFAAMNADLDRLSPPAERSEWEMKQQYAAVNRFSVLAGTFPQAYPIRSNADDAWAWYQQNNLMLPPTCPEGQAGGCSHRATSSPTGASNHATRTRREAQPQQ
jgi:hypothetical protein